MRLIIFILLVLINTVTMAGSSMPVVYFLGTNQSTLTNAEYAKTQGFEIKQYNMDGHLNLEKELSRGLPQDFNEAERVANERLEQMDLSKIKAAFQGLAVASAWNIKKFPAFVFSEGKFAIYGVTDVREAINRWNNYRGRDHYRAVPYR